MSSGRDVARHRLEHIRDAADAIAAYTDRGREAFDRDAAVGDAILYRIVVIGQAAKAVVQQIPRWRQSYQLLSGRCWRRCATALRISTGLLTGVSSGLRR